MHTDYRPRRRDWLAVVLAGTVLGAFFLGAGGRAGMRVIALAADRPPAFTVEGSLTVVAFGAACGAFVAAIFLLIRTLFPARRWVRGGVFWAVCGALMLRGLHPVTPLEASVFLPLLAIHGTLIHLYWCRIHLPRRRDTLPMRS